MTVLQSTLRLSLLDMVTGKAAGISRALTSLNNAAARNSAAMDRMRGRMAESLGAGYALAQALSAPIKAAVDFESTMADIKKVVDFPTPVAFAQMGKDIRDMSLRIPMAADGIGQIVAAAGQSGIAKADLLAFTEMAAKVGVAWDVAAGEAGESLAKLKTATGRSVADVGKLADAINHLGNNSAAGAPQILDVVKRVAPMAKQFGMTAEQVAALGAAMTGSGFESEVAATSILNVGRALTKGGSASTRQVKAFKALGLSSRGVAKSMQKDAMGTLQNVLTRIGKVPAHLRAALVSDIFGDEARALGPLISNSKLLAETLGMVADETQYAGSAQKEFETRSDTTANSMQLFRNRVNDLAISVGNALIPPLNKLMDIFGPMITDLRDLVDRYPKLTAGIIGATAAVIGFRVATTAAAWAGLFMKGSLIALTTAFLNVARATGIFAVASLFTKAGLVAAGTAVLGFGRKLLGLAFAPAIVAFKALRTAVIGYAASAAIAGQGTALALLGRSLLGLLNPMALVRGAFVALRVALISTGLGAIVVGLAAAGIWIYNNWNGISRMFSAFGSAFMTAMKPVMPVIQPVIDGVSNLWAKVTNLLGPVDGLGKSWFEMGRIAGTAVGEFVVAGITKLTEFVRWVSELPGRIMAFSSQLYGVGSQMIQNLWDGVTAKFNQLLAWFKEMPSRIVAAIGTIDLSNIFKLPSIPSPSSWGSGGGNNAFGGGTPPATGPGTVAVDGARADGGPVRSGKTYLVGERGPELFSPRQSGVISPNEVYRQARAANAPVATATSQVPVLNLYATFNVNGNFDPRMAAEETLQKLGGSVRNAVEASFGAS
ncbi:phage tail tape measure protein [Rhizobium sp. CFBP 8762]|uniref:phage tail tape measure protein n=1 Tax=Rhizobium sp. CFBP 8762 TaxID=2775279 RepID=UPI00177FA64A|nr:phage tail tape measure protein [Rhizobium sp. CFBP 8762]MBD8556915.1 phage tail tape measure protein [Rhizobium sp. CFBP 8762]